MVGSQAPEMRHITDLVTFWNESYPGLSHDYTIPAGLLADYPEDSSEQVKAHCTDIAWAIHDCLRDQGQYSTLLNIRDERHGETAPTDDPEHGLLVPRALETKKRWTEHVVCVSGGYIYDPIFPYPLTPDEYFPAMFTESVTLSEYSVDGEPFMSQL